MRAAPSLRPRLAGSEAAIYTLAVLAAVVLVLYPLASLVRYAWFSSATPFATMRGVLTDPRVIAATWNSLTLAAGTTILATAIGTGLAVVVGRTNTPFTRLIAPIGILPLLTMPFVGAVAWSLLASPRVGLLNVLIRRVLGLDLDLGPFNIYSMPGLIWVMGLYYSPYVFILTGSALRSLDGSLEEASRVCGASPARVLWHTTIPLVLPAILSGALLIFSFSMGQFAIPQILGIPGRIEVLSTVIYAIDQAYPLDLVALMGIGCLLLGIAGAALLLQRLWLNRRNYEVVAGKGARSQILDLGAWKYLVLAATLIYVVVTMVLPLLALIYSSLTPYSSPDFNLGLLTFASYRQLFADPMTLTSITNSLMLATISATACLALGLVLSYIIHRTRLRGRPLVNALAMLPIGIPGIVIGVGVLAAWINPPLVLYGTMAILVVSYVANSLPTATQAAAAGLVQIGRELEEAARVNGASWSRMIGRILLPLLRPTLVGAWLLLFITKFRELDTSVLLYTPGQEVVSVTLLNLWGSGLYAPVAAFSVIITLVGLAVFLLMTTLGGRQRVMVRG